MASLIYKPRTELEAVNTMLEVIGEQPTNSLEISGISEVSLARELLHNVSREVQSMGLNSNTEEAYPLPPDVNGHIVVPLNVLFIDATDPAIDVVVRGNKLYDRKNHTFVFSKPLECDMIWFLAFEDLPQATREYVTIKAARQFQSRFLGSETLFSLTAQDERAAWINLLEAEAETGDYSIFDNYTVNRILRRG